MKFCSSSRPRFSYRELSSAVRSSPLRKIASISSSVTFAALAVAPSWKTFSPLQLCASIFTSVLLLIFSALWRAELPLLSSCLPTLELKLAVYLNSPLEILPKDQDALECNFHSHAQTSGLPDSAAVAMDKRFSMPTLIPFHVPEQALINPTI